MKMLHDITDKWQYPSNDNNSLIPLAFAAGNSSFSSHTGITAAGGPIDIAEDCFESNNLPSFGSGGSNPTDMAINHQSSIRDAPGRFKACY